MANEFEEEPEELVEEADMFDLLSSSEASSVVGKSAPKANKVTSTAGHGVFKHVRPVPRTIAFSAMRVVALVIVALALTQGLTAALRTSLPERVAGISGSTEGTTALSVETKVMTPVKPASKPSETSWRAEVTP